MTKTVDYYFTPMSPWAYLGHEQFQSIATTSNASINVKVIDPIKLFEASGGLPPAKRPIQRQKYRMMELKRWKDFLRSPIILEPRYFPYEYQLANLVVTAVNNLHGSMKAMEISFSLMTGCWVDNEDMGAIDAVTRRIESSALNAETVLEESKTDHIASEYAKNTQDAIDNGLFGAPTYVIQDELFWGQDRLDFVERKLKS